MRKNGRLVGTVESDGIIRKEGRIVGSAKGVDRGKVGVIYFFGLFDPY